MSITGTHYDYKALEAERSYNLDEREVDEFVTTIYGRLADNSAGAIVIDLGCGSGRFVKFAPKSREWSYIGLDHNAEAIMHAKQYEKPGDKIIQGDIVRAEDYLAEFAGRAKAVVSHRVLHAVPEAYHEGILGSARKLMQENGEFYVSVAADTDWKAQELMRRGIYKPDQPNDCRQIMFMDYGIERNERFDMRFYSVSNFKAMLEGNGFKVIQSCTFQEPSGYEHLKHKRNTYHGYTAVLVS